MNIDDYLKRDGVMRPEQAALRAEFGQSSAMALDFNQGGIVDTRTREQCSEDEIRYLRGETRRLEARLEKSDGIADLYAHERECKRLASWV